MKRVQLPGVRGGSFVMSVKHEGNIWTTAPIPHDASPKAFETRVRQLPGLETVEVTGRPGAWEIHGDNDALFLNRGDGEGLTGIDGIAQVSIIWETSK